MGSSYHYLISRPWILLFVSIGLSHSTKRETTEELLQSAIVQQYQSVEELTLTETILQKAVTLQDPHIDFYDINRLRIRIWYNLYQL